jgi:hypothetical protein
MHGEGERTVAAGILADGTVAELRVWRPLHPACDAEALRVARPIRGIRPLWRAVPWARNISW